MSAAQCVEATECDLGACIVHSNLVECLLRTPLSTRITRLALSDAEIWPETIIKLVHGLLGLVDLQLPDNFDDGDPSFYESLARARPEIERIDSGFSNSGDDACMKQICELPLEKLSISQMFLLTKACVGMILDSPCSQTLRHLDIFGTDALCDIEIHALVAGCPLLHTVEWETDNPEADAGGEAIARATEALLVSRGGGLEVRY